MEKDKIKLNLEEQIAIIEMLRWDMKKPFAWWKRHLKVCFLISFHTPSACGGGIDF